MSLPLLLPLFLPLFNDVNTSSAVVGDTVGNGPAKPSKDE
jgi:hypothetical protein